MYLKSKITLFFILCFVFVSLASNAIAQDVTTQTNNPYIKSSKEEVLVENPAVCSKEPFSKQPLECWHGEKIIFKPYDERSKSIIEHYGYQVVTRSPTGHDHPTYKEAVGRIGTISIIKNQPYKKYYTVEITMDDNGQKYYKTGLLEYKDSAELKDIVFIKYIDEARKTYINKKLWDDFNTKITIKNVVVSDQLGKSVKLIGLDSENNEKEVDVDILSCKYKCLYTEDLKIVRAASVKKEQDSLKHKYKKYKWSNKVWKAIFNGKVYRGMSKLQAQLSWGEPESINRTSGSYGTHEQWVYGGNNYLYFENGVLTSIQN